MISTPKKVHLNGRDKPNRAREEAIFTYRPDRFLMGAALIRAYCTRFDVYARTAVAQVEGSTFQESSSPMVRCCWPWSASSRR
jgi:hypothetical protein